VLYQQSGGRFGHRLGGVPTLLMTTTGRRTGQPRTAALTYARDGNDYLVVASIGGEDQPPAWLHNVRAQPLVELQVGRERLVATARIIERDDPDHARLWKLVNANNHNRYEAYQRKTERPIPVIALTPS
jgi:deazaflavin-dependent oxidoreductase (nitroreductase family)